MVYLDAASTEPLHPLARETLLAALDAGWGDPARIYGEGRRARLLLDQARETVGGLLGCRADEVSFTTSGTQAAALAVLGGLAARRRGGRRLVVSAVEHSAVLHAGESHERAGGSMTVVPVDRLGRARIEGYAEAMSAGDVGLACLQSANHEVGTLQPVDELAELCLERDLPLYVDASQSAGRLPVARGWSLLSASAHKWGGPAGVGVLAVRRHVRWRSPLPADERGGGKVPGFENVPAILAAAAALEALAREAAEEGARLSALVERIRTTVPRLIPDVEVLGDPAHRLPHLVAFSCLYVDGESLITELDRLGYAVNSGSSCTASTLRPSHVLEAMGVLSHGNVRVSLPRGTSGETVDGFLGVLPGVVRRLRAEAGASEL